VASQKVEKSKAWAAMWENKRMGSRNLEEDQKTGVGKRQMRKTKTKPGIVEPNRPDTQR